MAQGNTRPLRHSRHPSRINSENAARSNSTNRTSKARRHDEATVAYIKRTLCARPTKSGLRAEYPADDIDKTPLEELLPPLTSSNEVDIQLYAIIAAVLQQFVQTWYNKITPDSDFVTEIVQIIAHCTRAVEERLRHVDLENLLLEEVAGILEDHVNGKTVPGCLRAEGAPSLITPSRPSVSALKPWRPRGYWPHLPHATAPSRPETSACRPSRKSGAAAKRVCMVSGLCGTCRFADLASRRSCQSVSQRDG